MTHKAIGEVRELLPCPFCGGSNLSYRFDDIEGWVAYVECHDCDDMTGPMSEFKYQDKDEAAADARERWNRRSALDRSPTVVEEEGADIWAVRSATFDPETDCGKAYEVRMPDGKWAGVVAVDTDDAVATMWVEWDKAHPTSPSKPEQAPSPVPQAVAWTEAHRQILSEMLVAARQQAAMAPNVPWYRLKAEALAAVLASPLSGGDTGKVEEAIRELCGDELNGGFIRDLCFTVWSLCHNPTHEDGNTDWGNDTLPTVQKGVAKVRAALRTLEGKRT